MTEDEMAPVPTDVYLKNWINKQRYYYKHGRGLGRNGDTEERVKLLLALGGTSRVVQRLFFSFQKFLIRKSLTCLFFPFPMTYKLLR